MANPRDLAEQAFALLQNALQESEARASELDEELKRKRQPKNRIEEQLEVLTHRLEKVEEERTHWEKQAGHLEEVAEAERAKVAQLKKKLEVAESGPEKLTKKEINFWRAKAESIDIEIKEYKDRLAGLRRELNERDAQIAKLEGAAGAVQAPLSDTIESPPVPTQPNTAVADLRRQLEQRDEWLAELRLELHEVRSRPAPPLEVQAEVETLRSQIAGLERALADAHTARATAQSNAARFEQDFNDRERALREATAAGERAREALAERELTIREAATASDRVREEIAEHEQLVRELTATAERARDALEERENRLVEMSAEVEQLRQREAQQRDDNARADEQLNAFTLEIEALRATLDQERQDSAAGTMALRETLSERDRDLQTQRDLVSANETDFRELRDQIVDRDAALDAQQRRLNDAEQALADARRDLDEQRTELTERDRQISSAFGDLEHARTTVAANERELTSLRETLLGSSRELDELRAAKERFEKVCEDAAARATAAQNDHEAAREQIAGLEAELKEEREHAESLGELANERREHMTKLQEQLEEAEERYADANWRLGKSLHFERIVKRRKGLVLKLLDAIRAKMKANTALKAGLDGLRTFKASSEINQQKLLQRVDALKTELREAHETVKRHQGGTAASEELANAVSRATQLEQRLNTQAELIQTLEADLKKAKLSHKPAADDKSGEVERLTQELATKNELITRLQADSDDQQKKLAKLRGSESETMRLKALTDKDRSEIDALQREVNQLREALTRQAAAAQASSGNSDLEAKLKEREQSVTRLMGTIKEHESTIKKLTESSDSWKRKYQFLASDSPESPKSAAEK
jgi:chromosome segregation ATPase